MQDHSVSIEQNVQFATQQDFRDIKERITRLMRVVINGTCRKHEAHKEASMESTTHHTH